MSVVFGESGPKNVEVLNHPTRRQSKVGGPPMPATVPGDGQQQRGSLDSVMDAEAGDHFEMLPAPPAQQPRQNRTWAAVRPAVAPQLSSQMSSSTSSTVSSQLRPGEEVSACGAAARMVVAGGVGAGSGSLLRVFWKVVEKAAGVESRLLG